jgi:predicted ATP-dependent endonuclease of OLD family
MGEILTPAAGRGLNTAARHNRKTAMLLQQLTLSNLLSFGATVEPVPLGALNLVVGPNGSGKSNLLEAIDLLRNAPDQVSNRSKKAAFATGCGRAGR